jgi:hypothetical protein
MKKILTPEEQKYLRMVCNYLRSMGMTWAEIEYELETWDDTINFNPSQEQYLTKFTNNYTVDIPFGLKPILRKIIDYCNKYGLFGDQSNVSNEISYQRFEIYIDAVKKEIGVIHYWSWYDEQDAEGMSWDGKLCAEIFDEWKKEGLLDSLDIPEDGQLEATYDGGGDSGYLEESFTNGEEIPEKIGDWMYNQLEYYYSGWEINEGSSGRFTLDFKDIVINLSHSYNTEEGASDTLWEEEFGDS